MLQIPQFHIQPTLFFQTCRPQQILLQQPQGITIQVTAHLNSLASDSLSSPFMHRTYAIVIIFAGPNFQRFEIHANPFKRRI